MIKRIAVLLAALLLFSTAALAVGTDPSVADRVFAGIDEEGGFIIQVVDEGDDDTGEWGADEPETETAVVRIVEEGTEDGLYSVRYEAGEDGEATVFVYHYTGTVCDELHGFDLTVEGGVITGFEETVYAATPDEELLDKFLSGEWAESDRKLALMTVAKAENGWDISIRSAVDDGANVFTATVFYDCELDALVYENGAIASAAGEGETIVAEAAGLIKMIDAGFGRLGLVWKAPDGNEVTFVREDEISTSDWAVFTDEATGVRMILPADFADSAEKDGAASFDQENADLRLRVLPVEGTFESIMDLVALDENAEGADTVMQSDINGVYFVFLQGEDGTWFAIDALGLNGAACRFLFTLKDPESTQGQTVAWLMIDSMQHAE